MFLHEGDEEFVGGSAGLGGLEEGVEVGHFCGCLLVVSMAVWRVGGKGGLGGMVSGGMLLPWIDVRF